MDCRPPGSSVHGISQARILQWVPFPSLGDPPNPGIKPMSPALAGGFYVTEPPGKPILWWPQTKSWLPSLPQNTVTIGKPRLHLVSLLAPEWPLVTVQIAPRSGSEGPDPASRFQPSPEALAAGSLLRGLQAGTQSTRLFRALGDHMASRHLLPALSVPTCCSVRWGTLSGTFCPVLMLVLGALPGATTWNSSLGVTPSRWHHRLLWIQSCSQEDRLAWKNFNLKQNQRVNWRLRKTKLKD